MDNVHRFIISWFPHSLASNNDCKYMAIKTFNCRSALMWWCSILTLLTGFYDLIIVFSFHQQKSNREITKSIERIFFWPRMSRIGENFFLKNDFFKSSGPLTQLYKFCDIQFSIQRQRYFFHRSFKNAHI